MENENANTMNPQGGDLSSFRKAFSDYQNNQTKNKRKSKEEILAKYFVPRKTKETFRVLPYKTDKFHVDVFFHVVTTNISGGKNKHNTVIYCPAHNDPRVKKLDSQGNPIMDGNGKPIMIPAPCPLCEKAKRKLAEQDNSIKFIKKENMTQKQLDINEKNKKIFAEANKWEAKKFYIVKGVDKGAEKDGVKFWRFKHNFKNQGTLDKLYPILDDFNSQNGVSFCDPKNGTDLNIIMADTEWNGHAYKTISAITTRGKSPLHTDPVVMNDWLEDDTTWRQVFLPKKAPGITPFEYLEMVVKGTTPYWDDTDANNRRWVFPGRPDLEEKANTRTANLDADDDENYEYASDLDEDGTPVTITNISSNNVGSYKEDAQELTSIKSAPAVQESTYTPDTNYTPDRTDAQDTSEASTGDYDDLPF